MPEILVNPSKCLACRSCELACAVNRDSISKTLVGAAAEEIRPQARVRVQGTAALCLPVQCRHCAEAPCLAACPSGALYRSEEGTVLLATEKCVGCWMCVAVCPFGAVQPARAARKSFKCDRCTGMAYPYCVNACPTGALAYAEPDRLKIAAAARGDDVVDKFSPAAASHICEMWRLGLASLEREV